MKKVVVLTGAGISAESGIKTFRDADGLWEGHDAVSYTHLRAHETVLDLVCRLLLEKKKKYSRKPS